ncbi:hypothetical protein Q31a_21430 [Aureliella helgolandensis]|uniref:Uncharacterized protein n=1 Tax=Aureliella helgolandensis TaxID=2527968 RepID=A0A518G5G4_9BACT|nr:hypothetical protein Q31a_21430 [Aureliella helgolandensis]
MLQLSRDFLDERLISLANENNAMFKRIILGPVGNYLASIIHIPGRNSILKDWQEAELENLLASGWWVKTSPLPRPVDEETGVQSNLQSPLYSFETAMEVSYSVAMRMTRRAHEQQKPVVVSESLPAAANEFPIGSSRMAAIDPYRTHPRTMNLRCRAWKVGF